MGEVLKEDIFEILGIETWGDMKSLMDSDYLAFVEAFPYEAGLILAHFIKSEIEEEVEVINAE